MGSRKASAPAPKSHDGRAVAMSRLSQEAEFLRSCRADMKRQLDAPGDGAMLLVVDADGSPDGHSVRSFKAGEFVRLSDPGLQDLGRVFFGLDWAVGAPADCMVNVLAIAVSRGIAKGRAAYLCAKWERRGHFAPDLPSSSSWLPRWSKGLFLMPLTSSASPLTPSPT